MPLKRYTIISYDGKQLTREVLKIVSNPSPEV